MKILKSWAILGIILIFWEIFWFIRFKLTINIAQTIAMIVASYGFYLTLIYLLITIIFILIKQKKK